MTSSSQPLASFSGRLALVGAGQMGGALLNGWLDLGLAPRRITVVDPRPPVNVQAIMEAAGVGYSPLAEGPPADVVVLAVKPQIADEVMPLTKPLVGPATTIVSVMAGKTIAGMAKVFGSDAAIVRTIPNTPAAVGRGVTGAFANDRVDPARRATIDQLLSAVGRVVWVEKESLIDVVTAVSGSGPAYVFYLVETLARAGIAAGLSAADAMILARSTVEGAGELLHRSSETPASVLRERVTSPNGTTFAALQILMDRDGGVDPIMERAVKAAARRSRELAG